MANAVRYAQAIPVPGQAGVAVADFVGIWANKTAGKGLLEEGDIDEALNAARQIGDDTIQKRTQGYVVPDAFNHGTAEQRRRWFGRGFESGQLDACDTFSASQV